MTKAASTTGNESLASSKKSTEELKNTVRTGAASQKKFKKMTEAQLRKQNIAIEKLKKDNELLKEQLESILRNANISQSVELGARISSLNEENDELARKIQKEEEKIKKYQEQTKLFSKDIKEARKDMGGVNVAKENTQMIDKQIKVLENRLDKALVKFNEALAYNKQLRDTIENLRQERVVFDEIYKKMEKELHEKKKKMATIIENSNKFYEERDDTQHKLATLKVIQEEVMEKYDTEFKILDEIIKKCQKKDDELNEKLKQKEKERKEDPNADDITLKKKLSKANYLQEQKLKHQNNVTKVKQFEEMFKKIETNTGLTIDELIQKFTHAEDQNFSLFTYVNELNSEIEKLEEQISELEAEIKKYKGEGASSDLQRKKILTEIQEQVNMYEGKAEQYDNKYKSAMKTISSLATGIQSIFASIGCDSKVASEMLGTTGVTETNMMVYLGMIEQRVNELITQYSVIKGKKVGESQDIDDKSSTASFIGLGPQFPAGTTRISISPPPTGEGEDEAGTDDTEEERPLTREELMEKSRRLLMGGAKKTKKKPKKNAT